MKKQMKTQTLAGLAILVAAAGLAIFSIGCKKEPSSPPKAASPDPTISIPVDPVSVEKTAEKTPSSKEPLLTGVRWYTDFEEAKAVAQKENKDLLINFSGSDWCIFCIKMEKEVFSDETFAKEAEKYFVFMLVDFPSYPSKQSPQIRRQNEQLAGLYHFRNLFPTIYLAKPDGTPYAVAEYQPLGPTEYLEYLLRIRQYRNR
jgi:thioredoxin-related protein